MRATGLEVGAGGVRVPGCRDGGRRGPLFLAGLPRRERALPERAGDLPGGVAAAPHLRGQHPPVSGGAEGGGLGGLWVAALSRPARSRLAVRNLPLQPPGARASPAALGGGQGLGPVPGRDSLVAAVRGRRRALRARRAGAGRARAGRACAWSCGVFGTAQSDCRFSNSSFLWLIKL